MIVYKQKKATQKELLLHLEKCDALFIPNLSTTVNLNQYALKITSNAITFEAWDHEQLVAVVAAYFNNIISKTGFITNVSIVKEHSNRGIASELLSMAKTYASENGFHKINLKVHPKNTNALKFYLKNEFKTLTPYKEDFIVMEYDISNK